MRTSQFYLSTLKEAPAEAELVSHKLMLRAGMIKRMGSGLYTWLPLGLRVLRKVENIIREEMDRAGAQELLMPVVQPSELWKETGRWTQFGPQMLKIKDRHERDFCFGPTHEEVITDIARNELRSYKQLPVHFYQIQIKFRDEIRPRFGVMRAREFLMKDGYSFHANFESLQATYQVMYETYHRIFGRLGLKFRAVAADTGSIGGASSHEFHVLAEAGEDNLAYCPDSDYAVNVELAEALFPPCQRESPSEIMQEVATPKQTQCEDVATLLGIDIKRTVKACALLTEQGQFILALLRGDHTLNEAKLSKLEGSFRFASEEEIRAQLSCPPGFIGPVGVPETVRVVADRSVVVMSDFICGANRPQFHLRGVNFGRDLPEPDSVSDIRNVVAGDPSPDGHGTLQLCRGIEVGHVFQLRTQYSRAMHCQFTDLDGQLQWMEMGCYGIGVSRIVSAAIEQSHDEKGICFSEALAPFMLVIVPVAYHRSEQVRMAADQLYGQVREKGIDVLLDDREERPGVLFADMELVGIPHRITISERNLAEGQLEYFNRVTGIVKKIALDQVVDFLQKTFAQVQ